MQMRVLGWCDQWMTRLMHTLTPVEYKCRQDRQTKLQRAQTPFTF